MDEMDSLTRLQGLQADLVAFTESRLPNVERLWYELERSIDDFGKLLDRKRKNDGSRQALKADKITVQEEEYAINEDFRQEVIQVADTLDLDELEAAKLVIISEGSAQELDRPAALTSILHFHASRETLLDCLRLVFQVVADQDVEPEQREVFGQVVNEVVNRSKSTPGPNSSLWERCVNAMGDIEQWIKSLDQRLQGMAVIGQSSQGYALEAFEFHKASLVRQHESLGAIVCFLIKEGHSELDHYRLLLSRAAGLEIFDDVAAHYVPALLCFAASFGPADSTWTLRDARSLDQTFSDTSDKSRWRMTDFRAAASIAWLAEYSGRYNDNPPESPLRGVNLEQEAETRSERFMKALEDGAFQFLIAVCSKIQPERWHDPAKAGLITFLLGDVERTYAGSLMTTDYFQDLLLQQLQVFVDAFITNMPDTIRKLKFEEDEHRRNFRSTLPPTQEINALHLERFLVLVAYAFQRFPESAHDAFWSDPDSNTNGFLHWASKRQSTPRVAAFCELFQSLAQSEDCADAAHKFLLDDTTPLPSGKVRKGASISWLQIFSELGYYSDRLQETPGLLSNHNDGSLTNQVTEPESELMLECYLRLISHLCRNTKLTRDFLIGHDSFHLHQVLLNLVKSGINSRSKACAFDTLSSMLTLKSAEVGNAMWNDVDTWIYGIQSPKPGTSRPMPSAGDISQAAVIRLRAIASGFEESKSFVSFLQALITSAADQDGLGDSLPFPEQLGAAYRMPGMDQYIDFVFEGIFKTILPELPDIEQVWELNCACLGFAMTCLASFNEDLVVFANNTNINVDSAMSTSSLAAYVRLHPFARVMEWLFNDATISRLFAVAHENVDVVSSAVSGSPLIISLCRSIEVIDTILRLESTYFDIVRPIIKMQSTSRSRQVGNPALASFQDAILGNLTLVIDLGLYCGTGHQDLTMLSMRLLQRLASSRKLTTSGTFGSRNAPTANRVVAALQQDNGIDRVTAAFIAPMQLDEREFEFGEAAPGVAIKDSVLTLLNNSMDLSPDKPGLAHCLLGFTCHENIVTVDPEGRFAKGASLFHAAVRLYVETAGLDEDHSLPWLSALRFKMGQLLQKLMRSKLTGKLVLNELRESGAHEHLCLVQRAIAPNTTWSERTLSDGDFLTSESSLMFRDSLEAKAGFFQHSSLQLLAAKQGNAPSLRQKVLNSLLGNTVMPSGDRVRTLSVFDLFDFVDLDLARPMQSSVPPRFTVGLDFTICKTKTPQGRTEFDLRLVKELLMLREAELRKSGQLTDPPVSQQWQIESENKLLSIESENRYGSVLAAQQSALSAWVQLMSIVLETAEFEAKQKPIFVLQALQCVLPKLDAIISQESSMALSLAKLVYALVQAHRPDSIAPADNQVDVTNERLLHAFRIALHGIASSADQVELRNVCYQIACHFLRNMLASKSQSGSLARHVVKTIDSAGERLVDIICEDALASQSICRVAALLMLEACAHLFQAVKATQMVRSLTRLNFVVVLVDSVRSLPEELQQGPSGPDPSETLDCIYAGLSLLLRLSRSADGAAAILDAGLFSAVRDSQLFATDPDIGLDIGDQESLQTFYHLLTAILQIVNSIVLTKGARNDHVLAQGRQFLGENRQCMQAIFKSTTRVDARVPAAMKQSLSDLVDYFSLLITTTGFLEHDEKSISHRSVKQGFS